MDKARLYNIPASHPGFTAALMLDAKSVPFKRIDLLPVVHKAVLRGLGFPGTTVPALKIDGRKVQGTVAIARELDRVSPEPPLLPEDPALRGQVLGAEKFGDEELQHPIRQILWWLLKRNSKPMASYLEGSHTGIPIPIATKTAWPLVEGAAWFNKSTDENVRAALAGLPDQLDLLDAWIAEGVLGGDQLNAADYQVATSIGLAMTVGDLRPLIENRPIGKLANRVIPDYPGSMPPGLPDAWLAPLRS
ncbi:MAG: glutathione S-transferase N-terminal domain-containing protein [Thermoleophilia bacterium]|nr:glutathione S-transferase N-terminal domain-containing protein [Thermoleophilia bacterium]